MRPFHDLVSLCLYYPSVAIFIGVNLFSCTALATDPPSGSRHGATLYELANQEYESLLKSYPDYTFEQLKQHLGLEDEQAEALSFDPEAALYYESIRSCLKMTDEEHARFKSDGLVVIDPKLRHSFGSAYYQIYTSDLPVMVTTDSILHAWHRSYDNLLQELEYQILMPALAEILKDCHGQLAQQASLISNREVSRNCRDVDLYLTVARNLLEGAGGPNWTDKLGVPSVTGVDEEAIARLADIKSLRLQVQTEPFDFTEIYGGKRFIDYSQFKPRGHYTQSSVLENYFRCMMWLGRADCGFNVLPVDPVSGIKSDWRRELRAAALISQLTRESKSSSQLSAMTSILQLLVGESDNLTVSGMLDLLETHRVADLRQLNDADVLDEFAAAVRESGLARQRIRSQSLASNPYDTYKVSPPALFQLFGQVFSVDSLLLSHSVFDSILFQNSKQRRMMPSGLDVAATLGNDYAVRLLEPELRKWNYSANLLAGRDFVDQLKPEFWRGNVYHRWLEALRTLDDQPSSPNVPEVMQRSIWRAKQLQTQLASWSELRHDNVLSTKQSYTGSFGCQYPDGFVEPYPALYAKLGDLARTTAVSLRDLNLDLLPPQRRKQDKQIHFLNRFAEIMDKLELIAQRELKAEPMTSAEQQFIKTTIDERGSLPDGSGRKPRYDGWYCELLYNQDRPKWSPNIVDVHTDPKHHAALHVGVGDINLAVIAIDNQRDVAAYVGPVYSYYEFTHAAENRLDDETWEQLIYQDALPARPAWTKQLVASPQKRTYDKLAVQEQGRSWCLVESSDLQLKQLLSEEQSDEGLQHFLEGLHRLHFSGRFGIRLGSVTPAGLQTLVDVPNLAWVDILGSEIPAQVIEDFSRQRPDVQILPHPFGVKTVEICQRIDGFQRFEIDSSRALQPGRPLLLYVEPVNLSWHQRYLEQIAKLEVTATLIDSSGATVTSLVSDPIEYKDGERGDFVHASMKLPIPKSLKPGVYDLRVELTDKMANTKPVAAADLRMTYSVPETDK